jgi:D-alanyl-D-alanine carboxypeptidase/D-alanyl-D-alanine-endopeptidase (penicillin-binding protein 4)
MPKYAQRAFICCLSAMLALSGHGFAMAQAETLDGLQSRIAAYISQPRFAQSRWGVKVVSLDSGKVAFEHDCGKYFNPASNAKLYTAALALDRLGADYRIKTSLYSMTKPDANGALKGDLIVYGRGDPTITARLNGGDYFKALEPLVDSLASAGVRLVAGDIIGDESYFRGSPLGSGWEWDDLQWYYGAEASALSINDNSLDLFVKPGERVGAVCKVTTGPSTTFVTIINRTQTAAAGTEPLISVYRPIGENIIYVSGRLPLGDKGYTGSIAVHNPAGLFVALFKEALARRGIVVLGKTRTVDWKYREVSPIDFAKLIELGWVYSPPLKDIVREMLKPSQNLYAQLLLLQVGALLQQGASFATKEQAAFVGATRSPAPPIPQTTEQAGLDAMKAFLAEIGIKKNDVLLEEGSGLSRRNMITPDATVALLTYMSRHRWAEAYRNALPIAGVDGTLQNRMRGTAAANNARAKTGTLRYVYSLSGYVTTAAGERLAFSIMLNNHYNPDHASSPRDDIDAIVVMLASFNGHT